MRVGAIDVGYGNVKFSRTENGVTHFDHFPSIAALSLKGEEAGQTHDLSISHKDLKPEVVVEAGAEQLFANTGFAFLLFQQV